MKPEIILCVPGPWGDRTKLLEEIIVRTEGEFMFAGGILACPSAKDHVPLEYEPHTPEMEDAFRYAGQGKISDETLQAVSQHKGVAYLHFPLEFIAQRDRMKMFTTLLRDCGGIGIKNESSGVAHEWDRWFELIESEDLFDSYCACIVLVADDDVYYSCGMHHFGLPEVQISRNYDIQEAAKFINDFNLYQLIEEPNINAGHTFSLTSDGPKFRIGHVADNRHDQEDLFYNSAGVWSLETVEQDAALKYDPRAC